MAFSDIAFDGINYFVVWAENRIGMSYDIYGARVTASGIVLDTSSIPIAFAPDSQVRPVVVFDGCNFLVAWQDYRFRNNDIYAAYVDRNGVIIDTFVFAQSKGDENTPALAAVPVAEKVLLMDSGWCETIGEIKFNSMRVFGEVYELVGISETNKPSIYDTKICIFPNPSIQNVYIRVKGEELVSGLLVSIYDITGRLMKRIKSDNADYWEYMWDRRDENRNLLPSGVYFIEFRAKGFNEIKKLIILQ